MEWYVETLQQYKKRISILAFSMVIKNYFATIIWSVKRLIRSFKTSNRLPQMESNLKGARGTK